MNSFPKVGGVVSVIVIVVIEVSLKFPLVSLQFATRARLPGFEKMTVLFATLPERLMEPLLTLSM